MLHLIGDLQGCCDAFERLLAEIGFSPSRQRIVVLGDLVNRGPQSLAALKLLRSFGDAATCLLGNHDLHLLAVAHGVRKPHRGDTLDEILAAPDRDAWLEWLRHRKLAWAEEGWLCVHAGVVPQWTTETTLALAREAEAVLGSAEMARHLDVMYGDEPRRWSDALEGTDRWRFVVNVLTRMRLCTADGELDFKTKSGPATAPPGYVPWYDAPERRTAGQPIAFGHWSALGLMERADLLGLDTGCVWGGTLTAVRVDGGRREIIQVQCEQAQEIGD